ncbi:MAG: barstar family protein [Chitinophagales bacterium]|nr:barstar family protein [Romboutsia sp.]MCB9033611.1 barstar family protein [Chitinophagales bacterium]
MHIFSDYLIVEDTYLAFVDGTKSTTRDKFFQQIAAAMQFPDYFSHNLDSLDEIMSDLSWIEQEKINILIFGYDQLLINDNSALEAVHNIFAHVIANSDSFEKDITIYTQSVEDEA